MHTAKADINYINIKSGNPKTVFPLFIYPQTQCFSTPVW